jgi:hypothetical protein
VSLQARHHRYTNFEMHTTNTNTTNTNTNFADSTRICKKSKINLDWVEVARANDEVAKARMKKEFDERVKAREPWIRVGSMVMLKLDRVNKATPAWDPQVYEVISINGSMITAKRGQTTVTRNSSFFKVVEWDEDEDEVAKAPAEQAAEASETQQGDQPTVEPTVEPAVEPEAAPTLLADAARRPGPGRPTKEQRAANEARRAAERQASFLSNPPARSSDRIRAKGQH